MRTGALTGLPYALRAEARPRNGFTFRRDCNGLCMRSPFVTGRTDAYLPVDATLLWSEMATLLRQRGANIADIPAPGSASVSTVLATFNQATRAFDRVTPVDVRDLEPLRRQLTDVLELGYKGAFPAARRYRPTYTRRTCDMARRAQPPSRRASSSTRRVCSSTSRSSARAPRPHSSRRRSRRSRSVRSRQHSHRIRLTSSS